MTFPASISSIRFPDDIARTKAVLALEGMPDDVATKHFPAVYQLFTHAAWQDKFASSVLWELRMWYKMAERELARQEARCREAEMQESEMLHMVALEARRRDREEKNQGNKENNIETPNEDTQLIHSPITPPI